MNTTIHARNTEVLTTPQRWAEPIITIFVMVLVGSFFAYHQLAQTGFFTEKFGPMEMLCLYVPIALSLAAPIARAVWGRRNAGRPFEVITNVGVALAALWLLRVFPFDFTHLADALPAELQFTLAWVTDDIGRLVLILQVIVGLFAALITTIQFLVEELRRSTFPSRPLTS